MDQATNEKECMSSANLVSLYAKRFGKGHRSLIGPGSEKKRYSISEDSPQGEWDNMAEGCCWNSQKADVQFSVLRAHCPEVDSKAKVMENCRYTIQPIWKRLRLRIIVSANQLSLYGAVAEMCEEFETHQDRSGRPDTEMGQTIVLSETKAEVPLVNDIPSNQNLPLQRYEERIELLSQENKVSIYTCC